MNQGRGADTNTAPRARQGSTINEIVRLISPQFVEAYSIPLSSGIMAGEAIMGALIAGTDAALYLLISNSGCRIHGLASLPWRG
jgi:hypothetical protein